MRFRRGEIWWRARRCPRQRRRHWLILVVVLFITAGLTVSPVGAAFLATTTNGANQVSAAATFPTYPSSVIGDTASVYHRGDESPSSAATLAAADASGTSEPGTYNGTTNGASLRWTFDEGSGTTAADSSGAANPGTLGASPKTTRATGTSGFNGTNAISLVGDSSGDSYVSGSGPAVATNASFTVAAWVYLTNTTISRVALSQNGNVGSGFLLRYNHYNSAWEFALSHSESYTPAYDRAYSTGSAIANSWVHLVGVYDSAAGAGQHLKLYVDGAAQVAAGRTSVWNATGALQAGRAKEFGAWQTGGAGLEAWGPWAGRLDEVRTWRRALSATEVANLASDPAMTRWDFSETVGSASTADLGARGNTGTLGAGVGPAAFTASGHSGNAVTMSRTANGYVQGSTSAVHTNASFTVATWVYLNSFPAGAQTAVSQKGTASSGFVLKYDSGGRWAFTMPRSDVNAPTPDQVVSLAGAATAGWVHLAGVYDDAANTIRLYVGGTSQGTAVHADIDEWDATGALQAGRAWWDTAWADAWSGRLDSVRLYQRALDATAIAALRDYTTPTASWTEPAMTLGVPGALQGAEQGQQSSTAVAFAGGANAYNNTAATNPTTFTIECWFKTSSATGGMIMGFGSTQTGTSANRDRHIYLDSANRLTFGVVPLGTVTTVRSTTAYNDGAWHHVAGSLGAAGVKLYVDGHLVASDPTVTAGQNFTGYWRWGGNAVAGSWPNPPTTGYLTGTIDEVAIYNAQLTDQQILWHYYANH